MPITWKNINIPGLAGAAELSMATKLLDSAGNDVNALLQAGKQVNTNIANDERKLFTSQLKDQITNTSSLDQFNNFASEADLMEQYGVDAADWKTLGTARENHQKKLRGDTITLAMRQAEERAGEGASYADVQTAFLDIAEENNLNNSSMLTLGMTQLDSTYGSAFKKNKSDEMASNLHEALTSAYNTPGWQTKSNDHWRKTLDPKKVDIDKFLKTMNLAQADTRSHDSQNRADADRVGVAHAMQVYRSTGDRTKAHASVKLSEAAKQELDIYMDGDAARVLADPKNQVAYAATQNNFNNIYREIEDGHAADLDNIQAEEDRHKYYTTTNLDKAKEVLGSSDIGTVLPELLEANLNTDWWRIGDNTESINAQMKASASILHDEGYSKEEAVMILSEALNHRATVPLGKKRGTIKLSAARLRENIAAIKGKFNEERVAYEGLVEERKGIQEQQRSVADTKKIEEIQLKHNFVQEAMTNQIQYNNLNTGNPLMNAPVSGLRQRMTEISALSNAARVTEAAAAPQENAYTRLLNEEEAALRQAAGQEQTNAPQAQGIPKALETTAPVDNQEITPPQSPEVNTQQVAAIEDIEKEVKKTKEVTPTTMSNYNKVRVAYGLEPIEQSQENQFMDFLKEKWGAVNFTEAFLRDMQELKQRIEPYMTSASGKPTVSKDTSGRSGAGTVRKPSWFK